MLRKACFNTHLCFHAGTFKDKNYFFELLFSLCGLVKFSPATNGLIFSGPLVLPLLFLSIYGFLAMAFFNHYVLGSMEWHSGK